MNKEQPQDQQQFLSKEQVEHLRKIKLFIGIPCYAGQLYEQVMMSLMNFNSMAQQIGIQWTMETLTNESLITRGRNTLTSKFLTDKTNTHLLFIDSDIGFKPEDILLLLLRSHDPRIKLIGGLYPLKTLPLNWVVNGLSNGENYEDGLTEVSKTGTGFMLIDRSVFETVKSHPRVEQYNNDLGMDPIYDQEMYNFWDCSVIDKRYLSEDWLFCHMYRELGGKVWVDRRIQLRHTGTFTFSNDANIILKQKYSTLIM